MNGAIGKVSGVCERKADDVMVSLENPQAGKNTPIRVHQHNVRITPEDHEFSATPQKTTRSTDTSSSVSTGTSSKGAGASSPRKHTKRVPSIHLLLI